MKNYTNLEDIIKSESLTKEQKNRLYNNTLTNIEMT